MVWRFLLDPEVGLVNNLLRVVGVDGPNWLVDTKLALPSLIVMAAWRNFGFLMVIFLAGLQGIPRRPLRGGHPRRREPRGSSSATSRCRCCARRCCSAVWSPASAILQFFEEPFVMTQGGPLSSTLSVSYHIYNQFGFGNYGYAAAASYVLFVAIVALSVLQFRLLGERKMTTLDTRGVRQRDRVAKAVLYAVLVAGLLVVVGPFVWMALVVVQARGRDPLGAADLAAGDVDAGQLPRPVLPARLPAVLLQLGPGRRRW